ncbi:MAG: hypothetical protein JNM93_07740 [Bacteriovoracaceae bacterium]|nr:hypothetical protein [Bacteriovoracaceae bacterium]
MKTYILYLIFAALCVFKSQDSAFAVEYNTSCFKANGKIKRNCLNEFRNKKRPSSFLTSPTPVVPNLVPMNISVTYNLVQNTSETSPLSGNTLLLDESCFKRNGKIKRECLKKLRNQNLLTANAANTPELPQVMTPSISFVYDAQSISTEDDIATSTLSLDESCFKRNGKIKRECLKKLRNQNLLTANAANTPELPQVMTASISVIYDGNPAQSLAEFGEHLLKAKQMQCEAEMLAGDSSKIDKCIEERVRDLDKLAKDKLPNDEKLYDVLKPASGSFDKNILCTNEEKEIYKTLCEMNSAIIIMSEREKPLLDLILACKKEDKEKRMNCFKTALAGAEAAESMLASVIHFHCGLEGATNCLTQKIGSLEKIRELTKNYIIKDENDICSIFDKKNFEKFCSKNEPEIRFMALFNDEKKYELLAKFIVCGKMNNPEQKICFEGALTAMNQFNDQNRAPASISETICSDKQDIEKDICYRTYVDQLAVLNEQFYYYLSSNNPLAENAMFPSKIIEENSCSNYKKEISKNNICFDKLVKAEGNSQLIENLLKCQSEAKKDRIACIKTAYAGTSDGNYKPVFATQMLCYEIFPESEDAKFSGIASNDATDSDGKQYTSNMTGEVYTTTTIAPLFTKCDTRPITQSEIDEQKADPKKGRLDPVMCDKIFGLAMMKSNRGAREACLEEIFDQAIHYTDNHQCKQFAKDSPEYRACKKEVTKNALSDSFAVPECMHLQDKAKIYMKGTEDHDKAISEYRACVAGRLGRNLLNNIAEELAKGDDALAKIASIGLSTAACIPRNTFLTNVSNQLHPDLKALGVDQYRPCDELIPAWQMACVAEGKKKGCDAKSGSEKWECYKQAQIAVNQDIPLNEKDVHYAEAESNQLRTDRERTNRQQEAGLCIAGVALDLLGKENPEIAKIGKAGLATLNCLRQGPDGGKPTPPDEGLKAEDPEEYDKLYAEYIKEKNAHQQRSGAMNACLINTAGSLGDLIFNDPDKAKAFNFIANSAATTTTCLQQYKPIPGESEEAIRDKSKNRQACLLSAGINAGKALFPDNENAQFALDLAARGMNCTSSSKGAEARNCFATQALLALGGKVGGASQEALTLAATALDVFGKGGQIDDCRDKKDAGDQGACVAAAFSRFLPPDAQPYVNALLSGHALVGRFKEAVCPSSKFMAAGAAAELIGQMVAHIHHQVSTKELEDEMKKKEDKDKKLKEKERQLSVADGSLQDIIKAEVAGLNKDVQVEGYNYQIKAEKSALKAMQIENTTMYIAQGLMTTGNTLAAYEMTGMATTGGCTEYMNKSGMLETVHYRSTELEDIIPSIASAENDLNAIIYMKEKQAAIHGTKNRSLSIDEYEKMQREDILDFSNNHILVESMREIEQYLAELNNIFAIPEAQAIDWGVIESIGIDTLGDTFAGKSGSGTYKINSPQKYAADMIYLTIKKAMDKTKGGENYTGKKTIEFAAKKATEVMLNKNKTDINKLFATTPGRIGIAAFNLYNFTELIKSHQDGVKNQKKKIDDIEKIKDDFIHGRTETPTGGFIFPQKNWKIEIWDQFISEAYANNTPNDSTRLCVTNQGIIDGKCRCVKANACFNPFPKHHSKDKVLNQLAKTHGKNFTNIFGVVGGMSKITADLFSGSKTFESVDTVKLAAMNEKLTKVNEKLMKVVNKKRLAEKKKPFNQKQMISGIEQMMYKGLDPKLVSEIKKMRISEIGSGLKLDIKTAERAIASINEVSETKEQITELETKENKTPEEMAQLDELKRDVAAKEIDQTKMINAMNEQYKKSDSEIHQSTDENIFKIISIRYQKVYR